LVEDAALSSAGDADRRGLELVVRCAPDVPHHVIGDCGRIRQVLVNLCNNALKFTPKGHVVLEAQRSTSAAGGARVAFSVTDTGTGIPAEAIGSLFDARPQAGFDRRLQPGASMTLRLGGTGRGLTVSRALARLMNGDIRVESELGKGSRFIFEIPLAVDDAVTAPDRRRVNLDGRKVLVVDDLEVNRRLMRENLEAIGARCETAGCEEEALEIVRAAQASADPIAFAFIDVEMPDTNGTVLCHVIKGELPNASPRFVLMASEKHRARTRTWQLAGFEACLQKPVRRSDLEDILLELLQRNAEPQDTSAGTKHTSLDAQSLAVAGSRQIHKDLLGLNVLIVEDNLVNQRVAERMLEKLGCNVAIADDGREALARCDATRFDLVLMDCQMPVLDGFAATEELRKRERSRGTARLPIIALTANATKGDRDQCLAAGMDDHLAKPIVRDELVAALTRWRPRLVDPYPALPSTKIGPQNPGVSPVPSVVRR
jgi:two-component system sensor histidine kinase/response regulator